MLSSVGRVIRQQFIGCVALFVALGGVSYAAFVLPDNSVGTRHIKKGAVTRSKLAKGVLASTSGSSVLIGPQGPEGQPGPQGPQGERGPAGADGAPATRLWASINYTVPQVERGSGALGVVRRGPGRYVVWFDRDVSACSFQVTLGSAYAYWGGFTHPPGVGMAQAAAEANAGPTIPIPDSVYVFVTDMNGALMDAHFHLAVFC